MSCGGVDVRSESMEVSRHLPMGGRITLWLLALACLSAGIVYLRNQKAAEDHIESLPPSIESVRVAIERTTDPQAASVSQTPKLTSLAALRSMPRPRELDQDRRSYSQSRIRPFETQVWTFRAKVLQAEIRTDNDLYLVVESDGVRSCVEVPDPHLCRPSPLHQRISSLRERLQNELHPGTKPVAVNREANLTGIGYFGTAGKGENGARLMPLLDVKWLPN